MTALTLRPDSAALVVIDFQEKLASVMPQRARERAIRNVTHLVEGASRLGMPILVTEQYPKGLGPTVAPIREPLAALEPAPRVVEKIEFDVCANPECGIAIDALGRRTLILTGLEAHICVWQSARGLVERGYAVHVPVDATCSRRLDNRRIAEGLWNRAGAVVTCTETVLFDLLGKASGEHFKVISKRIR